MTKRLKTAVETGLYNARGGKLMFEYEAVTSSPHRAAPKKTIKPLDSDLSRTNRKTGTATTQSEVKNGALLAWMIRRHVDYVSRFEINFRSGIDELDDKVHSLLKWHRRRNNWDFGGRHNRDQWSRIFEMSKIIIGDAAGVKLKDGKLQGLDSDQIAFPDDWGTCKDRERIDKTSKHGLIIGKSNEVVEYCICVRNENGQNVFDHFEKAENVVFDGYFSSFNQTRGQSPLLAAINDVIDMRDIVLFSKINLKLKNLFAMAVFRDSNNPLGGYDPNDESADPAESTEIQELTPGQVNILDLDAADKIQSVESNSPSPNAMDFMDKLARISMLALDIPFTALDSSRASFSARIADRAEYEEACEFKRDKNADVLREIYIWRFNEWYRTDKELRSVADAAGYTPQRIADELDFMPAGTPWMDKLTEVKADMLAVALGIDSIPRIARRMGLDAYQIGQEQADYIKWAESIGLPIFYASGGQDAVQNILSEPRDTSGGIPNNSGGSENE